MEFPQETELFEEISRSVEEEEEISSQKTKGHKTSKRVRAPRIGKADRSLRSRGVTFSPNSRENSSSSSQVVVVSSATAKTRSRSSSRSGFWFKSPKASQQNQCHSSDDANFSSNIGEPQTLDQKTISAPEEIEKSSSSPLFKSRKPGASPFHQSRSLSRKSPGGGDHFKSPVTRSAIQLPFVSSTRIEKSSSPSFEYSPTMKSKKLQNTSTTIPAAASRRSRKRDPTEKESSPREKPLEKIPFREIQRTLSIDSSDEILKKRFKKKEKREWGEKGEKEKGEKVKGSLKRRGSSVEVAGSLKDYHFDFFEKDCERYGQLFLSSKLDQHSELVIAMFEACALNNFSLFSDLILNQGVDPQILLSNSLTKEGEEEEGKEEEKREKSAFFYPGDTPRTLSSRLKSHKFSSFLVELVSSLPLQARKKPSDYAEMLSKLSDKNLFNIPKKVMGYPFPTDLPRKEMIELLAGIYADDFLLRGLTSRDSSIREDFKNPLTGVFIHRKRRLKLHNHKNIFFANEAVDWLSVRLSLTRREATIVARNYEKMGDFKPVGGHHTFRDDLLAHRFRGVNYANLIELQFSNSLYEQGVNAVEDEGTLLSLLPHSQEKIDGSLPSFRPISPLNLPTTFQSLSSILLQNTNLQEETFIQFCKVLGGNASLLFVELTNVMIFNRGESPPSVFTSNLQKALTSNTHLETLTIRYPSAWKMNFFAQFLRNLSTENFTILSLIIESVSIFRGEDVSDLQSQILAMCKSNRSLKRSQMNLGASSLNLMGRGLKHYALGGVASSRYSAISALYLDQNGLETLSPKITELRSLETLSLSDNKLTELPSGIRLLSNLKILNLSNNQISDLAAFVEIGQLTSLKDLGVANNQLTDIPPYIRTLTTLQVINFSGNPIPAHLCPERILCDVSLILKYSSDIPLPKEERTCKFAKLAVIGENNTGKTSLLRALQNFDRNGRKWRKGDARLLRNEGQANSLWKLQSALPDERILINTIDFPPSALHFSTHRSFLTSNCVYLCVFSLAPSQINTSFLDYWIESCRHLAPTSPIFLVGTHLSKAGPLKEGGPLYDQMKEIWFRFQGSGLNLVKMCLVDSIEGFEIEGLFEQLVKALLTLPCVARKIPLRFSFWIERVMARGGIEEAPVLDLQTANLLGLHCTHDKIAEEDFPYAMSFLNQTGFCIQLSNKDHVVLLTNSSWLLVIISKILGLLHQLSTCGICNWSSFQECLQTLFPPLLSSLSLQFMEAFGLGYCISNRSYQELLNVFPDLMSRHESQPLPNAPFVQKKWLFSPSLLPKGIPPHSLLSFLNKSQPIAGLLSEKVPSSENVMSDREGNKIYRVYAYPYAQRDAFYHLLIQMLSSSIWDLEAIWTEGGLFSSRAFPVTNSSIVPSRRVSLRTSDLGTNRKNSRKRGTHQQTYLSVFCDRNQIIVCGFGLDPRSAFVYCLQEIEDILSSSLCPTPTVTIPCPRCLVYRGEWQTRKLPSYRPIRLFPCFSETPLDSKALFVDLKKLVGLQLLQVGGVDMLLVWDEKGTLGALSVHLTGSHQGPSMAQFSIIPVESVGKKEGKGKESEREGQGDGITQVEVEVEMDGSLEEDEKEKIVSSLIETERRKTKGTKKEDEKEIKDEKRHIKPILPSLSLQNLNQITQQEERVSPQQQSNSFRSPTTIVALFSFSALEAICSISYNGSIILYDQQFSILFSSQLEENVLAAAPTLTSIWMITKTKMIHKYHVLYAKNSSILVEKKLSYSFSSLLGRYQKIGEKIAGDGISEVTKFVTKAMGEEKKRDLPLGESEEEEGEEEEEEEEEEEVGAYERRRRGWVKVGRSGEKSFQYLGESRLSQSESLLTAGDVAGSDCGTRYSKIFISELAGDLATPRARATPNGEEKAQAVPAQKKREKKRENEGSRSSSERDSSPFQSDRSNTCPNSTFCITKDKEIFFTHENVFFRCEENRNQTGSFPKRKAVLIDSIALCATNTTFSSLLLPTSPQPHLWCGNSRGDLAVIEEPETPNPKVRILYHCPQNEQGCCFLSFSPPFVIAGWENPYFDEIRIWNAATMHQISSFNLGIAPLAAFCGKADTMVALDHSGELRFWVKRNTKNAGPKLELKREESAIRPHPKTQMEIRQLLDLKSNWQCRALARQLGINDVHTLPLMLVRDLVAEVILEKGEFDILDDPAPDSARANRYSSLDIIDVSDAWNEFKDSLFSWEPTNGFFGGEQDSQIPISPSLTSALSTRPTVPPLSLSLPLTARGDDLSSPQPPQRQGPKESPQSQDFFHWRFTDSQIQILNHHYQTVSMKPDTDQITALLQKIGPEGVNGASISRNMIALWFQETRKNQPKVVTPTREVEEGRVEAKDLTEQGHLYNWRFTQAQLEILVKHFLMGSQSPDANEMKELYQKIGTEGRDGASISRNMVALWFKDAKKDSTLRETPSSALVKALPTHSSFSSFYSGKGTPTRDVVSVSSFACSPAPPLPPNSFPVSVCEEAFLKRKFLLSCAICQSRISLDDLIPEIALALWTLPDFNLLDSDLDMKKIGDGGYSNIYLVDHRKPFRQKNPLVLKMARDEEGQIISLRTFRTEVWIMGHFQHPLLVSFSRWYPNAIKMEFMSHGDLRDLIKQQKNLDIETTLRLGGQVAIAMRFLHGLRPAILHLDLKSLNVLLTKSKGRLVGKISDFGQSHVLSVSESVYASFVNCTWVAPEVLATNFATKKSDVYSYGLVLWEMVSGKLPFEECKLMTDLEAKVLDGERPSIPPNTPLLFSKLIEECWGGVPQDRPSFSKIVLAFARMIGEILPGQSFLDLCAV